MQIRVGGLGQRFKHREVRQHRQQASQHDDRLAADLVRQRTEDDEERRADHERCGHKQVGRGAVHLERLGQEEQGIELAGVPHHGLACGQAHQRQNDHLQVFPLAKRLGQRRFGGFALGLHFLESRRLVHGQADVDRHAQQHDGDDERHSPTPVGKGCLANSGTGAQNHHQGQEETQRCRGLDPGGVGTALAVGSMLGHVGGCAAILTAQRQALQQTQTDQDDRCSHADAGVGWQDAHDESGQTHDQNGHQEGVLATDHVAQSAKHQCAERTHDETGGESQQGKNEGRPGIQSTEELLGDDGRQRTIQIKVVPLEHRTQR